jgi:hypothetical protein
MSKGTKKKRDANGRPGYRASLRDLQYDPRSDRYLARAKTNKHMATPDREIVFPYKKPMPMRVCSRRGTRVTDPVIQARVSGID